MSHYKVLARKYRPTSFHDLLGQKCLVKTLENAITSKQFPHAILLTGVRGIGKTTTARIIARSLNCIGVDGNASETINPCGICRHCIDIKNDNHLDVVEMDAASRTGVDDVRQIIETSFYRPASARYKIHIIDEVHMLTKQAFNALLKTLEQPPEYTKFIFATTEINRIPDTIISRCIRFDLKKFTVEDISSLIRKICEKEKITIDNNAIQIIAKAANGSARDSLSLLEQAKNLSSAGILEEDVRNMLGIAKQNEIIDIFQAIIIGDVKNALMMYKSFSSNSLNVEVFIQEFAEVINEATKLQISESFVTESFLPNDQAQKLAKIAKNLTIPILTRLWQVTINGLDEIKKSSYSFAALEMIIIRLCYLSNLPTADVVLDTLVNNGDCDNTSKPAVKEEENIVLNNNKVTSINDLLSLFDFYKEPLLRYQIENNTYVVLFNATDHQLILAKKIDTIPNLINILKDKLLEWTKIKWDISFTVVPHNNDDIQQNSKTIREQNTEDKNKLIDKVSKTDLVKTALEIFPESGIHDVKLTSN